MASYFLGLAKVSFGCFHVFLGSLPAGPFNMSRCCLFSTSSLFRPGFPEGLSEPPPSVGESQVILHSHPRGLLEQGSKGLQNGSLLFGPQLVRRNTCAYFAPINWVQTSPSDSTSHPCQRNSPVPLFWSLDFQGWSQVGHQSPVPTNCRELFSGWSIEALPSLPLVVGITAQLSPRKYSSWNPPSVPSS